MKYLLLTIFLLISCKKTHNTETKDDVVNQQNAIVKNQRDSLIKTENLHIKDSILKNYNTIYTAYDFDSSDAYSQILAINWISKDSIEYIIDYENQLCEGICKGIAIRKYADTALKEDKNTGENSYFIEYSERKEELLIVILIEPEKEFKAKTTIYEGNYASECSPYEFVMTKKD